MAMGISPPNTMGGNSKILLEMLRNAPPDVECIVITPKPETFAVNKVHERECLRILAVPSFLKNEWVHHYAMCRHFLKASRRLFLENGVCRADVVFCVSDNLCDVYPAFVLQHEFGFKWVPSFFLFIPFVFENVFKRYGFPILKYFVYYLYQKVSLFMILARGSGCVITNEVDKRYFPVRLRDNLLPIYGGVNVEQIPDFESGLHDKPYDAVFCSRLHPQKGVMGLLDIWREVVSVHPNAKLAIIGNGAPKYEEMLRRRAHLLGLDKNILWLGYVNNEAKYAIYAVSRVFVHATVFDNNGMVAAEALCTGLPVVMYDLPALRSLYTDGCVKVREGDRMAFAQAILALLMDPGRYEAVRPTFSQIAAFREKWAWQNRAHLFFDFIKRL